MVSRRSSTSAICVPPHPDTHPPPQSAPPPTSDWYADRYSILLLVLLYAAQGLPVGLAFGTIPFLLKDNGASYAALATFSISSLPYSLKLLIAPAVDAFYSPSFGRRKSWIVPVQLAIGLLLFLLSTSIHRWVLHANVAALAPTFFLIIALVATQDIAVDGWSLTMLRKQNISFASPCQSLGLSLGYFSTFTIFLALSNHHFCDSYIRPFLPSSTTGALLDLALALRFVGLYYLLLTAYVTFAKNENVAPEKKADDSFDDAATDDESSTSSRSNASLSALDSIRNTYRDVLVVVRLPAVRALVAALLVAKLGFSAHDNVSSLKLLELGFSKESMASMAVIQAPITLLSTVITGTLVADKSPITVYLIGYFSRLVLSLTGPPCVAWLARQNGHVTPLYFLTVLCITILYSIAAECLMFIGIGAFFLRISSSSVHVAGSYLTLLNTSSNMGGIWHKAVVLWLVDKLTVREHCVIAPDAVEGTQCPILYDGYYVIAAALVPVALAIGLYLVKKLPTLGRLPESAWRASR